MKNIFLALLLSLVAGSASAAKQTHTVDSVPYCGTLQTALPFVGMQDATAGACGIVPTQCNQQQTADVYYQINNHGIADATKFENIFGKSTAQSTPVGFPGIRSAPRINNLLKTGHLSAKFTVPTNISPNASGTIGLGDPIYNHFATFSISQACGDFAPSPTCTVGPLNAGQGITWKINPSALPTYACVLVPGVTYFFNAKFTTPPATSDLNDCSSTTCRMRLTNTWKN